MGSDIAELGVVALRSTYEEIEYAFGIHDRWNFRNSGKPWQPNASTFIAVVYQTGNYPPQLFNGVLYVVDADRALLCSGDSKYLFLLHQDHSGWHALNVRLQCDKAIFNLLQTEPHKIANAIEASMP